MQGAASCKGVSYAPPLAMQSTPGNVLRAAIVNQGRATKVGAEGW